MLFRVPFRNNEKPPCTGCALATFFNQQKAFMKSYIVFHCFNQCWQHLTVLIKCSLGLKRDKRLNLLSLTIFKVTVEWLPVQQAEQYRGLATFWKLGQFDRERMCCCVPILKCKRQQSKRTTTCNFRRMIYNHE